ncbi:MAG: helix-turn-helix transcriptional regulator [Ruminococcus sp.]|nr:helix-turn-helix transcriptional regulator [Ruminococcus sp.]
MRINMIGWHWTHPADFNIERPNGVHGMQLILVRSKARIIMGETEYNAESNTAFLTSSCFPHSLHGAGEEYADDWIRFELEEGDKDFLDSLGMEFNVPVKLPTDSVSELIRICRDIYESDDTEKEAVIRCLMNAIMLQIKSAYSPKHRVQTHYDSELDSVRQQIYDSPSYDWTIPAIAEKLNLSVAHFQRLYKQRYGVSCTKDILTSRMELAKQLLSKNDLSAVEISEKCGYTDYSHFSRVFLKYACVSPAKYRKDHLKN